MQKFEAANADVTGPVEGCHGDSLFSLQSAAAMAAGKTWANWPCE